MVIDGLPTAICSGVFMSGRREFEAYLTELAQFADIFLDQQQGPIKEP